MAASDQVFRFAAGLATGRRSAVYRVWAPSPSRGKVDVYFSLRRMGEDFKVSLHGPKDAVAPRGHLAVSRQTKESVGLHERFLHTWERPGSGADDPPDFQLVLLESELRSEPPIEDDFSEVHWLAPPPRGGALVVSLVVTNALDAAAREDRLRLDGALLARFDLGDGGRCLVALQVIRTIPTEFLDKVIREKTRMRSASPDFRVGAVSVDDHVARAIIGGERSAGGPTSAWIEVDLTA